MNTYDLPVLLKMWAHEELTPEQRGPFGRGQLLLHVTRLDTALFILEKALSQPDKMLLPKRAKDHRP